MTVFQGERFISEAIRSLLLQTIEDLELWVVDDASIDKTSVILNSFVDSRLKAIRNTQNVENASGEYIARLDADDLAEPQRLEKQVAFFLTHHEIGILGSRCRRIDERGNPLGFQDVPLNDLGIRLRGLLTPPLVHSTIMWRRSAELLAALRDAAFGAHAADANDIYGALHRPAYESGQPLRKPH